MHIQLTDEDREDLRRKELVSADTITTGGKYFYRAKIGGERKLVDVQVKRGPFPKQFKDGRTSLYAYVYGYGFCGDVQITKLLVNQDKMPCLTET